MMSGRVLLPMWIKVPFSSPVAKTAVVGLHFGEEEGRKGTTQKWDSEGPKRELKFSYP